MRTKLFPLLVALFIALVGLALRWLPVDPAWRLADCGEDHVITVDLLARGNLATLLDRVQPATGSPLLPLPEFFAVESPQT